MHYDNFNNQVGIRLLLAWWSDVIAGAHEIHIRRQYAYNFVHDEWKYFSTPQKGNFTQIWNVFPPLDHVE